MEMPSPRLPGRRAAAMLALLALAGCASAPGEFPSLAQRPIERATASRAKAAPPPAPGVDPALAARLASIESAAHDADARFQAALPDVRRLADAAGAEGSESWVQAEQALSALGTTRAEGTAAVPELDDKADAIVGAAAPSPADLAAIAATEGRVAALDSAHGEAMDAITRRLADAGS